jgi:4-hydroxy-3-methylbut-2-enyl diphosphate reductase
VKFARKGYTIILIGHENHDEVIGTLGEAPDSMVLVQTVEDVDRLVVADEAKMSYLTQTTLSLDETSHIVARLRERFPRIEGPHSQDICYATENRQVAVKAVVPMTDLLLVVGSRNSSNSQRLVEVCRKEGRPAYLVDDETDVQTAWFEGVNTISITAGASAPEHLVERLIDFLKANGYGTLETLEVREEDVRFSLPPELNAARLTQISPSV